MIFNPEMECLSRERLVAVQLERLQQTVATACARVPFYRASFERAGVSAADVRSLDDLRRLPFIRKQDFREAYPFGLLAVPREQVRELHASSGTTGAVSLTGYTRQDIDTWAELVARVFGCAGARPGDLVHNAYGYGLFTGGLGFHYGALRFGCTVLPMSGGNTPRQVRMIKELRPDVLTCTPSYALHLAEAWQEHGFSMDDLTPRIGICGAEPWSEGMRRELQEQLRLKAVDIYGLAEAIGPGVSCECVEEQAGLHVFEDHFIVEVVNPATGEPVAEGERGELVFTSLTKEALPIIRYRTGDLSFLRSDPCSCGRTVRRMGRITGRADDMLVIRGINVFPSDVEAALLELPEVSPQYRLVVDREHALDTIEVQVEPREPVRAIAGAELEHRVGRKLREALGIAVKVGIVEPRTIPRSEGKALRVVDRRTL
jgi:phenylacetate-CoA ligase